LEYTWNKESVNMEGKVANKYNIVGARFSWKKMTF